MRLKRQVTHSLWASDMLGPVSRSVLVIELGKQLDLECTFSQ